mmetsp:Transcript_5328/g.11644  ORF Transcript_5328/g.11644 Transcript_5328/m.11644 type:complete len:538 (-) Transcript_5328:389-2002(-)|eukprot:CAMPEP_0202917910 /NCGR_PEP_ID=MMETSP1392-20130828/72140_1 /ASSEMBLY_ACC=CAM_ASM_000868 /TAXON_ID=225041 /ORGANISM="Chlamydomonas chlamydogama, Strain SAG 11-48b" /LENGTH=537 /DNA_ID=CAMNT_0049610805 /DNA_START=57 /DNA_END=1670 /DNA_ORIENTATION=-
MRPRSAPNIRVSTWGSINLNASSVVSAVLLIVVLLQTILVSNYRRQLLELRASQPVDHTEHSADLLGARNKLLQQISQPSSPPPSEGVTLPLRNGLPNLLTDGFRSWRIDQLERAPNGSYLRSTKFAPLRISVCTHRMPKHWAPCIKHEGVDIEYAEEVVYPAHKVRIPGFLSERLRRMWIEVLQRRGVTVGEGADSEYVPLQLTGQNFVFRNTRYTNNPWPDNWNSNLDNHCMGRGGEIAQFKTFNQSDAKEYDRFHEELFLANTPQSWSFQHFMDHVFKVVVQGMHLISPTTTDVLTSQAQVPSVQEIWGWFDPPVNYSRVIFGKTDVHWAKRLITSCRSPFWEPYNIQRWAEMALGPDVREVPMEQRKVVLYYSRSVYDYMRRNGGRRILNEEKLIPAIQALLDSRQQGEQLQMLNISAYSNYKDFARFINTQVRAIVGPHGGGLMNMMWGSRDMLVLEIQFEGHVNYAMWEIAPLLHLNYWVLAYPAATLGSTDMNVNIGEVVQVLSKELGKQRPLNYTLDYDYAWPKALVGL